jgi:hypothetical protein
MLGGRVVEPAIDHGCPVEAGDDREPARDRGRLEVADLLHPPDVQLQVRSPSRQRMQMTLGAPGEEAARVGAGVLSRRPVERGEIGGHSSVELVSCRPGVSGEWGGDFMLDHDPTLRSLRLAANGGRPFEALLARAVLQKWRREPD